MKFDFYHFSETFALIFQKSHKRMKYNGQNVHDSPAIKYSFNSHYSRLTTLLHCLLLWKDMGRSRVFAHIAGVYLRLHNNDVGLTTRGSFQRVYRSLIRSLFDYSPPPLFSSSILTVLGSNDLSAGQKRGVVHGQCPLCVCPLVRKKSHKIGSVDGNIQCEERFGNDGM